MFPWVSSTVASLCEAQSKERAKFLREVNVHCSKRVSEGFLYQVLGFLRVPWVSYTVASVFEPESKERIMFLRVSLGFPKGFPGFLGFLHVLLVVLFWFAFLGVWPSFLLRATSDLT